MNRSSNKTIAAFRRGGVGVIPTDTVYGLVGFALSKKAVARIYRLKRRTPAKPFIILIASLKDLRRFGVRIGTDEKKILSKIWPGRVSIVLPCNVIRFSYLHRGTRTLAFRMPAKKSLRVLLKHTGPLVAPSANPEGMKTARTIKEARDYFGERCDFYVNGGKINGKPSTIAALRNNKLEIIRQGAVAKKKLREHF